MRAICLLIAVVVGSAVATAPGTNGDIMKNEAIRKEVEEDAKRYLLQFGYMGDPKDPKSTGPTKADLEDSLERFQQKFLYYGSGIVDVPTQSKMSEYRCGNKDLFKGEPLKALPNKNLWQKKQLLWNITNYPPSLTVAETRDAVVQAFDRWAAASSFTFAPTNDAKSADIVISFDALGDYFTNVAARATAPLASKIVLDKEQTWGYRQHIPQGISLFHTLLHEIGHTLGLHHSYYRGSIMFPMMKPALVPFGTLDSVPIIDRIRLRRLYGSSQNEVTDEVAPSPAERCPRIIDAVTAATASDWFVFSGSNVQHVVNKKYVGNPLPIQQLFPRGPGFVNATVTSGTVTLLFSDRTIFGYEFDGVNFNEASGYPKQLHDRVLFYPQGGFPLTNGSIILLSGNVFATYNVKENAPSFLNDKNRYFPNLPLDLKSGVLKDTRSADAYWMFDESTVSDYDMMNKQTVQVQEIKDFFKC